MIPEHGILNLLKPPGMTSHDAVSFVRRTLKTKRVGHTGTLDPAAAGVLPICVGLATRLVEDLTATRKKYLCEATFGFQTDTLDQCGQTVKTCDASALSRAQIEAVLDSFRGEIWQTPPMFSAIKIGGKKLYELAREGQQIEIPARQITVFRLEIARFEEGETPRATIEIECSSGTYIRSLVRDIGEKVGFCATMTSLLRTQSGHFLLENAQTPEEFAQNPALFPLEKSFALCGFSLVKNDDWASQLAQGKSVSGAIFETPTRVVVGDEAGTLYALCEPDSRRAGFWKPAKVFDLRK